MLTGKRVIVIDDEQMVIELTGNILESLNAVIFGSTKPMEGLQMVRHQNIDLVILDRHMPVMNGIQVLELIKKNVKTKHIPVIMLTAANKKSEIKEAIDAGADGYITKPFKSSSLIKQIEAVLKKQKL